MGKNEEEQRKKDEEERKRQEEERMKKEAEETAKTLHKELSNLLEIAEANLTEAKDHAASVDELDSKGNKNDEDIIEAAEKFEKAEEDSNTALKACTDFMNGKYRALQGSTEATKKEASRFLQRSQQASIAIKGCPAKVKAKKAAAVARKEKEAKRIAAIRAKEKEEAT